MHDVHHRGPLSEQLEEVSIRSGLSPYQCGAARRPLAQKIARYICDAYYVYEVYFKVIGKMYGNTIYYKLSMSHACDAMTVSLLYSSGVIA